MKKPPQLKTPRIRAVRFIERNVPYKVCSRILGGEFFLRPDEYVNEIIEGVIGLAQERFSSVRLYACVFMSNHMHLILAVGSETDLSGFIGFLKGEISRRLGQRFKKKGPKWERSFKPVALVDDGALLGALSYVLSHGTKEDLVDSPLDWPGVHCAIWMVTKKTPKARWFNGTRFAEETFRAKRLGLKMPSKEDFWEETKINLATPPMWELDDGTSPQEHAKRLIGQIEKTHRARRKATGIRVMGANAVRAQNRRTKKELPRPPYFKERKRILVAWISPKAGKAKAYVDRYWAFQRAYRQAAERRKRGVGPPGFPSGAWLPSMPPGTPAVMLA
jgi:REP element-mobilizing transposase RayT